MAIDIQTELPVFTVTDTLHQLVDRLNELTASLNSNNTLFDSSVNDLLFMVSRDSGQYTADSDLTIFSEHDLTLAAGRVRAEAGIIQLVSTGITEVGGTGAILLSSDEDAGNVLLRSGGSTFGSLRKNNSNLEITTGTIAGPAVTFSTGDASFPGTLTVTGLETADNTVQGAINEIRDQVSGGANSLSDRISDNESNILSLQNTTSGHTTTLTGHDTRISTIEGLNIANRLNTIESKITSIETRLGILGV